MSQQLSRKEFADIAEEYIRRLNEIADKQGFSVITAFYIEGTPDEPIDYAIDWRNMSLNENLHALSRWNQDIMNSYDEDEGIDLANGGFNKPGSRDFGGFGTTF